MKKSVRFVCYAVGFTALAMTGALAQAPAAVSIQLVSTFDYPGTGNQTRPQKISDKNDVVGIFVDSSGVSRGFIFYNNGAFSPPLVDPSDVAGLTEGRGINSQRYVCGDYFNATSSTYHGFFFAHGHYQNFDLAGATTTIILGLNNARDFAGSVVLNGGVQEAFVSIGGTANKFAITDATATLAYQLNTSDQSCGYYADSSGVTHGFWRDTNGTINSPIDPAGSTGTILFGNNDGNQMVGRYADSSGVTHGLLFIPSADAFVVYDFPGSTFTSLNGINKNGMIVGRYTDASGIDHGFLAQLTRTSGPTVTLPLAPASAPAKGAPQNLGFVAPAY